MAALANTAPAAAPAVATPFGTRWNNWVNGVFSRVVTQLNFSNTFSLALEKVGDVEADSTAKKIVKMAVLFIPLLAFSAFALVGSALSTIKACCCGNKVEAKVEAKGEEKKAEEINKEVPDVKTE